MKPTQLRIADLFIITGMLALEIAAIAQQSVVLSCLFISAAIIALAVVRERTLLRNILMIAMLGIWIAAFAVSLNDPGDATKAASPSTVPRR